MSADSPDEFLDIFDPWTGGEADPPPQPPVVAPSPAPPSPADAVRAPWEPPPAPAPPSAKQDALGTGEGGADAALPPSPDTALEPGVVLSAPPSAAMRRRQRREASPPLGLTPPARPRATPMQNPAGFLRQDGVPLIQDIARRLEAAQHYTSVQDMLDLPTPMLRVLLWPRPGLLDASSERLLVTLELVLGEVEEDVLAARYWLGSRPVAGEVEHLGTVSTADLTPDWLERQILSFVEKVLERI